MNEVDDKRSALDLSIIVIARNERIHIERCIQSAKRLGVQIYVIDSNSADGTAELASAMGARVVQCSADSFADKLNWALTNIEFLTKWVMRVDADELLTDELVNGLPEALLHISNEVSGILLRRRLFFLGKWIRHGDMYPTWTMRIWRKDAARCELRDLDEHMVLSWGKAQTLNLDIIDSPLFNLSKWIDKHNNYSTIEAAASASKSEVGLMKPNLFGDAIERRRWLKLKVFYKFPLFVRPALYFIYRYFFMLGFLDGKKGFIFHFMHAFWYRLLVDIKISEFDKE